MTVNAKLNNALSDFVNGNCWADTCPLSSKPKEYIVYYPLRESPVEYGDNEDTAWIHYMAVHWICKGNVNYTKTREKLRKLLKGSGFSVTDIIPGYDDESNTTHIVINCNIVEEVEYGTP